jgi:TonB-linked SusC/RagA family outer membrane protein
MKKNECIILEWKIPGLQKVLRIMKLTTLLLLLSVISVSASKTYSQTKTLTLCIKNSTVKEVLKNIEEQSEFVFMYSEKLIDVNREVTVDIEDQKINEVLDELFADAAVNYKVHDRFILLTTPEVVGYDFMVQQQKSVSGKVTDIRNQPLPGVSVVIKGITTGTVTNADGNFSLSIPGGADTLQFSFVGLRTQEVSIEGRTTVNVVMEEETIGIEEVVVVGYGTQKKSEITGSISSIKTDDIIKIPTGNIAQTLTGKATGLRVFDVQGDPSENPVIQIRGESTADIRGGGSATQPLFVIDGIPGGSFRDVPPEDIKSIEILKDAAAAAIYGARGANGVILIQTKRGEEGKVKFSFDSYMKRNIQVSKTELVRQYDHVIMNAEGLIASARNLIPRMHHTAEWLKDYPYVDYMEDMFFDTWSQRHRLSVTGGSKNHTFHLSGTYDDEPGTMVNNEFKQGTILFNTDHKIGKRMTWANSITFRSSYRLKGNDYEPRRYLLDVTLPYQEAVDRNDPGYYDESLEWKEDWAEYQKSIDNIMRNNDLRLSVNPSYEIFNGLTLSDRFTFQKINFVSETYKYKYKVWNRTQPDNTADIGYDDGYRYVNDLILNFRRTFNKHSIIATAVYSAEYETNRFLDASRTGLPLSIVPSINMGSIASMTNSGGSWEDSRLGLVGRLNYIFDERYVLGGSVRRDGSSRFPEENRWGIFPSVSFAWNLHKEDFMQNIDWISNARIRASWGKLGRDKLDRYKHFSKVTLDAGYAFDNSPYTGAAINELAYSGTGWEAVETIDVGFETYFLNNRLQLAYTRWQKTTKDLIFEESLPGYTGIRNLEVNVNAGELLNSGHEVDLIWKDKIGAFSYYAEMNFSTYKNKVVKWIFPEGVDILTGRTLDLGSQRDVFAIQEGYPFMYFSVVESIGLWQNDKEIDAAKYHLKDDLGNFLYDKDGNPIWGWPHWNRARPSVGGIKFEDRNGDGDIDNDDRYYAGTRYPKIIIGANLGFDFKGFDLYIQTHSHIGHKIFHELDRRNANAFAASRVAIDLSAYDTWIGEGSTNNPRTPRLANNPGDTDFSRVGSHALYKADFFRVKAINLGYTAIIPALQKVFGLSSIRIYATGINLLTFTKYPGFNPEMSGTLSHDGNSYAGFYRGYPYYNPKSYTFGLQVNF